MNKELSDHELNNVAGGGCGGEALSDSPVTLKQYSCPSCGSTQAICFKKNPL